MEKKYAERIMGRVIEKKTAAANKTVAGSRQQFKSRLQRILRSAPTAIRRYIHIDTHSPTDKCTLKTFSAEEKTFFLSF